MSLFRTIVNSAIIKKSANLWSIANNCAKTYRLSGATTLSEAVLFDQSTFHISGYRTMSSVLGTTGKFRLTEIEGDLFSAPAKSSFAHCVGADFAMAAGIAVKFKQLYGQVDELLAQNVSTGGVAVLKDNERYIYYLVTKPHSWDSPTYDSLRSSLIAMRDHTRTNKVNQLAIPRIGCGIDGLEWDKVSNELTNVFDSEDLEITVYNFVPK